MKGMKIKGTLLIAVLLITTLAIAIPVSLAQTPIQDAINTAAPGATVTILAGSYDETVIIDKALTLQGAGSDVVLFTGTITIKASDVVLDGFRITGRVFVDQTLGDITGVTISNNYITGILQGIEVGKASEFWISDLTIEYNEITGNVLKGIGFYKKLPTGPANIGAVTIRGNIISDNLNTGISTYGTGPFTIVDNTITGNQGNGISLKYTTGDYVSNNTVTDNDAMGINMHEVTGTVVEDNDISGHINEGVVTSFWGDPIPVGKGSGIYIHEDSTGNIIQYNDIYENNIGVLVNKEVPGDDPADNHINYNNIIDNFYYGIKNVVPGSVDATLNWWGVTFEDYVYEEVSGNVEYTPWLSAPIDEAYAPVSENPKLDSDFYHTGDTVTVTIADWEENDNPAVKEFLWPIEVYSETMGEEYVYITLQETGLDTGIFTGTFKLVDYTPGTGELLVSDYDHIDVCYYSDPHENSFEVYADVDDTPPTVEIISPEDLDFVHGETFSITYDVDDNFDWNVSVTLDGVEIATDIEQEGSVTWNTTKNMDGLHTITVIATDGAENSESDYVTVNIDNTGPSVTDYALSPPVVPPGLATVLILTATVSDDVLLGVTGYGIETVTIDLTDIGGGDSVSMLDDASGPDETAEDGIYTASVTTPTTLTKGLYNFTITTTDGLGNFNEDEVIVLNVIEDSVKPTIVSADIEYAVGAVSARPDDDVVITIVATDDLSGVASISINATEIGLTASEPMTGPVEYTWTATLTVGSVTVGTKTLNITATDYADNEDFVLVEVEVTAQLQGLYIDLEEGWNLFSLPLIPDDSSIEVVLADIMENVQIVWGYKDGTWSSYIPAIPDYSELKDMVDGEGYWVLMTAADTVTVSGVELPGPGILPPVYDVYEGWNLIGFKEVEPMVAEPEVELEYFTTIPELVRASSVCYSWDATVQAYEMAYIAGNQLIDFNPGQGYWLYLTEDAAIAP